MLIQGTAEGLVKVHNAIIEKVTDFPVPKDLAAVIGDRPKQVMYLFSSFFHQEAVKFRQGCQ